MEISPIILNTLPFDAELGCDLHYTYNGSQIFGYRLVIAENISNTEIYNQITYGQANTILDAVATVPAKILENGKSYNFQIAVLDHQ